MADVIYYAEYPSENKILLSNNSSLPYVGNGGYAPGDGKYIEVDSGFEFPENCNLLFSGCLNTEFDFSDSEGYDPSTIISMSNMFTDCPNLTSVNLSGWNTSNATDMHNMFSNCQNLTSVNFFGLNTSNVTNMHGMFADSYSLEEVNLKGFDVSSVTDIDEMFSNCYSLEHIYVGENTDGEAESHITTQDSSSMFRNCHSLPNIDYGNVDISRANTIEDYGYFEGVPDPPPPPLPSSGVYFYIDNDTVYFTNEEKTGYADINTSSNGSENKNVVIELYNNEFILPEDCTNLFSGALNTEFNDTDKGVTSDVTNMSFMFYNCQALTSLDASNGNTSNVTIMSNMFSCCYNLASLNVSNGDVSNVTSMSLMFEDCRSLEKLNLNSFYTNNLLYISQMFDGCTNLNAIDIYNFNVSKIKSMSAMFWHCDNLETIIVPASTNGQGVVPGDCSSNQMFAYCVKLPHYNSNYLGIERANTNSYEGYFTDERAYDGVGYTFKMYLKINNVGRRVG